MSSILNNIKQIVSSSIRVDVQDPVTRSGKKKYPVVVTDMGDSFTSCWSIKYFPTAQNNGQRLYDGAQTFSTLSIYKFSKIHNLILTANHYFLENQNVEVMKGGRRRAIYEHNNNVRLTVTSQANSVLVVLTVIDEESPFYMLSIPFNVVLSNDNSGNYYIIGSEDRWDRTVDMFTESNASFAPGKARFYRVHQNTNQPPILNAKIASNNGQFMIHPNGSFAVDVEAAPPEWIQVITNEYKALAYIYEQAIMEVAFKKAIEQGLPSHESNQISFDDFQGSPFGKQSGFVPAFSLKDSRQISENEESTIPLSHEQPPITAGSNVTLPWT
ncbi:hypothetical protein B14_200031 (plasmid) [Bacillus licheniformis]|uniref:hypothetical protein n=1 Tax=Bacillus licheniformis TaxID=1402 RepID=UPI0009B7C6B4|nr:hypothetical protein [Bacillus licheniformis]ARC67242.1 hypothetical protein B14_200031 [Bacillus licheniformis]ARW46117.1 hypothetical protein S100141_04897 [Bacillus licheniformis]MDE1421899.1 hypothetical protein [Bacillus licheniformis]MEC0475904.1 hypothetical protein [Bacillus licheniformis]QAS18768.1 hypothetical protein EQJ69_22870 [Bacillus licheniformis]